ncbi:MAG: DUF5060 domain-containing protein [Limisphaerales bacterium]
MISPRIWQRVEFSIGNVPAAPNPFDPDVIRVDGTFALPSGGTTTVPAFWYQGYARSLSGGYEYDAATGAPGWRLRYLPTEVGVYALTVTIRTNGLTYGGPATTNFSVPAGPPPNRSGYVGIGPSHQYFQTGDGQALRLNGEDVGWYDIGTYDYDTWFANMQKAGENYARVWMCPWAFGIEDAAASLTRYNLQAAWQLDYVLQLAESRGIYILLALDYHGMFATQPDSFGGNNYWPQNPYNATNGGPCATPDSFFTNTNAERIYEKRLRYLIGRYGYSENLLAWEFFNEIDNDYSFLNARDVAAWHGLLGAWLHTNDVFGHLVTTSLTGSSDRPEIWSLPEMDYANYHSYGEPGPANRLSAVARSFQQAYGKPVLIEEFGTSAAGWNQSSDPYLRGWRQGIWGGALGGAAGTAMSWWWQNIDTADDYPTYAALSDILYRTGWGSGVWTNIGFFTNGAPPATVENTSAGGQPVNVQLPLDGNWADITPGKLAVPGAVAAGYSAETLESFVQGNDHPDLRTPFQMSAWFTNGASLVMHLNSVSDGSIMTVLVDGAKVYSTNLPNLDGTYNVDEEYNTNFTVSIPSGKHVVTITNTGADWFYLDWVQLNQVLPATYAGNWEPEAAALGLRGPNESLLYIVAPGVSYPANATTPTLPELRGETVTLTNWPAGSYFAEWYDPATADFLGRNEATATNGRLTLMTPEFNDDIVGLVYPPPQLSAAFFSPASGFEFQLESETGGNYVIEESTNLVNWTATENVSNASGAIVLTNGAAPGTGGYFYRATKGE